MKEISDGFFRARLEDMTEKSEKNGSFSFSRFLDEKQCAEAEMWCGKNIGSLCFMLYGGYSDAKRKMLCICPDYLKDSAEFPIKCITFSFRKQDKLSHRDFLGALMSLNLKRETIGDIVTGEGTAQVFVTDTVSGTISAEVSRIGKTGVKCTDEKPFCMEVQQNFQSICGTVASLRLDCIVSLATGKSRENSAKLIRSEKTAVNCFTETSVSHEVREGDVISVRGFGKFILKSIDGSTRKDRLRVTVLKHI